MSGTPFKDHFSARAAEYARHRPLYPARLAQWLAGIAPTRALALDCGCGAGQLATQLAAHFERVVATDASADQLRHAQAHPRVHYHVARAEDSGLPGHSVDLLSAAQAAHWFDLPAFYAEARRVLRRDGVLALVSYGVPELDGAAGLALREIHDRMLGAYWPPERAHVRSGYRTLDFPFEALPAPALRMQARWSLEQLLGYLRTWSALRGAEAARGAGAWVEVHEHLRRAWESEGPAGDARCIDWPLSLRVARMPG